MNYFETFRLVIEIIVSVGILTMGIPYWLGQYKKGKQDLEVTTNNTLTELVNAQSKKIKILEDTVKEQGEEIQYLKNTLQEIKQKKTDLEALVTLALKDYFSTHPEVAEAIHAHEEEQEIKNI